MHRKNLIFLLGWIFLIFFLSNQPDLRVERILNTFNLIDYKITPDMFTIEFISRKLLHILVYFILTFIIWFSCKTSKINLLKKYALFLTPIIALFIASSDEFNQLFIKGRDGKKLDVLIDSIGIFSAVLFIFFTNIIFNLKFSLSQQNNANNWEK